MAIDEQAAPSGLPRQGLSASISNAIVGITRDYTGRGPTKARTYITDNLVTCVLQDTLTKGERVLADHEGARVVLGTRKSFQSAMAHDLIEKVQELTGREVIAFLSDNHLDPDVGVEVFVLDSAPHSADGSQADRGPARALGDGGPATV